MKVLRLHFAQSPSHTSQICCPQSQSVFVFVAHLQSVVFVWPHSMVAGGPDGVGVCGHGKEWDHLIKIADLLEQAEEMCHIWRTA